ncbi:MAG: tetratricopeptide repeat protein [Bacteroidetes bacterium]|nr:tetratricopeptide repeat protein [Bacteroidota bacterium]
MRKGYFGLICVLLIAGFILHGCGSTDFTSGKVREQNGDYKGAVEFYEKELQKNPSNAEAWFRMGTVKGGKLNDYEGMNKAFREVEKLTADKNTEIYNYRFAIWAKHLNNGADLFKRATGDSTMLLDKAIEEYEKSAAAWPDTSLTYYFLAPAYQNKGDIAKAIAVHKKIWEFDRDADAYKQAGRLFINQGLKSKEEFRSANADALRIQKNIKDIETGSYESDVKLKLGEPDSKAVDKRKRRKSVWKYNKYGLALTLENDRVVDKKITKKIDLKIDSTKYFEAKGYFNNAVAIHEEIKAENPKDNENLNLLLQAYYEANRIQEATKTFELAVNNDPGNKMNHYILGLLYRMVGNNDGAINEFNKSIEIDPEFSDAFYDIGATYYNWGVKLKKEELEKGDDSQNYKKKFEAALPWMMKVVEIKTKIAQEAVAQTGGDWRAQLTTDDARVWESMGTIYALLGKADQATKYLDEVDKIRKVMKR